MTYGSAPYGSKAFAQSASFGVDSQNKRMSAFNFCDPFDHILPAVDGTVDKPDRAFLWGMYTGIAAGDTGGFIPKHVVMG